MHSKGRAISHKSSNWSRTTTTIQAHAVHSVMDDLFRTIFFGDQDHRNTNLFLIRNGKIGKFFIWNQSTPILPSLVLLKSCKINCPWLNSQKCKPIFLGFPDYWLSSLSLTRKRWRRRPREDQRDGYRPWIPDWPRIGPGDGSRDCQMGWWLVTIGLPRSIWPLKYLQFCPTNLTRRDGLTTTTSGYGTLKPF